MPKLLVLKEPARTGSAPQGFALWELGFRPFYLLASVFAALSIALWAWQYAGFLPEPYPHGPLWHAHEMLFGFTLAVVAGFLFTAVRNWTQKATPAGPWLAALALLWIAGRVLVLTPYATMAAIVNVAFPLSAAVGIAIPLLRARNKRNYFFIGLLVAIALAQLAFHVSQLRDVPLPEDFGIRVGLDLVLFIVTVMGGRVIPMFTNNGIPGCSAVRHPGLERVVLGSTLAVLALDVVGLDGATLDAVLAVCAIAQLGRLALWQPWRTLRVPLVWILHAAYLWIPMHLALRLVANFDLAPGVLATHALTIGAIGGLTLGMMVRTARGHTARPLRADRYETTAFVLVMLACVLRVLGPIVVPSQYVASVIASAVAWSLAFALYAVRYAIVLTRPRLDGKPG